jgi:hypothetical protein
LIFPVANCREYARYPFMNLLSTIREHSRSDEQLLKLLNMASEYAEIYLLATQRQKGCDGLGEMTNLKDEFKGVLDEMIEYCRKKNYIGDNISCDIDLIADEVLKKGRLQ